MEIDFGKELKDIKGAVIKEDDKPMTLGTVSVNALLAPYSEEKIDGKEKARRYALAIQLKDDGKKNLSIEEIALLKNLIGKLYAPIVVGQAYEIFERKEE